MTEDFAELLLVLSVFTGLLLLQGGIVANVLKRSRRSSQRLDLEMCLLLALIAGTMVLLPVIDVLVSWLEFADMHFRDEVAVAGLLVGAAAIWLFWRAQRDLLRRDSRSRYEQELITEGVFRYVRHPFYTTLFLWVVAQALLLQNWLAGAAAVLTFLVVYALRIPYEEQRALERFGHRYLDYMSRTGSLLPRWPRDRRS